MRLVRSRAKLGSVLGLAIMSVAVSAQEASCNNGTRSVGIPPGISGPIAKVSCTPVSITVGAANYETQPDCVLAYTHIFETIYVCGPALAGLDCDPLGYQATIKNYSDGACPSVAGLGDGMHWDDWSDIPANLATLIENLSACIPPKVTETYDNSAKGRRCTLGGGHQDVSLESGFDGQGGFWSQTVDDPRAMAPSGTPTNFLASLRQQAMNAAGGTTSDLLAGVESVAPSVSGAALEWILTIEYFDDSDELPDEVQTSRVSGRMAIDGRFDVTESRIALRDEERRIVRQRECFDGATLLSTFAGSDEGCAYGPSHIEQGEPFVRVELVPRLRPMQLWLDNPFLISRFPQHTYEVTSTSGLSRLTKSATTAEGTYVDLEYVVDDLSFGVPVVLSTSVFDESGNPREVSSFSGFEEIASGVVRPMRFDHRIFYDGTPTGRRVCWRYQISSASVLPPTEVASIGSEPIDEVLVWTVWM